MMSVNDAAKILGISPRRVRKLIEEGRIEAQKIGQTWVVIKPEYTRKYQYKGGDASQNK